MHQYPPHSSLSVLSPVLGAEQLDHDVLLQKGTQGCPSHIGVKVDGSLRVPFPREVSLQARLVEAAKVLQNPWRPPEEERDVLIGRVGAGKGRLTDALEKGRHWRRAQDILMVPEGEDGAAEVS